MTIKQDIESEATSLRAAATRLDAIAVSIGAPPPPPPASPTASLTITPLTITAGQSATIAWSSTNATSAKLDGATVALSGSSVASPVAGTYPHSLVVDGPGGQVTVSATLIVNAVVVPPPPPPSGTPRVVHGAIPSDGLKGGDPSRCYQFRPDFKDGQRLTGVVTVPVRASLGGYTIAPSTVPHRLIVGKLDGTCQIMPSMSLDTTQFPDGTYVLGIQILSSPPRADVCNGSRLVVINNSNVPLVGKTNLAVIPWVIFGGTTFSSLNWARVDVLDPQPYPLGHSDALHPEPANDADRLKLANDPVWWIEGLNHQGTDLWEGMPLLVKNLNGDHYITQFNPEASASSASSWPWVENGPSYDGPRGVGWLTPYTTLTAGRPDLIPGQDWLGVDLGGRVVQIDIHGEVTTIFGPRSVAGVVGTEPGVGSQAELMPFKLAQRIAAGEKEFVGDASGGTLSMPQDIWQCPKAPTVHAWIADTLNNRVAEIHYVDATHPKAVLTNMDPIPGVTSVWSSEEIQVTGGAAWYAVGPAGLYKKPIPSGPVVKVADIQSAHWVRGSGTKVYVFTLAGGWYEWDHVTSTLTERKASAFYSPTTGLPAPFPQGKPTGNFSFFDIDVNGRIGPLGRIYFSDSSIKTSVYWMDTVGSGAWGTPVDYAPKAVNAAHYGSIQARDKMGHYMWGFVIHRSHAKFLTSGLSNSSWFSWTAHLGQQPIPDAQRIPVGSSIPSAGQAEFQLGKQDVYLAMASIYGINGHGNIGYSCDQFRSLKTWAEAKPIVMAALAPLFPPNMPPTEFENACQWMFYQRTRPHFFP